jgi:hypothetical protein
MSTRDARAVAALLAAIATAAPAARARAEDTDAAAAEALFQAGKRLLADKRASEACPKLAESYRLDAATGTLLALAMCHEAEGKLASAWAAYSDVAARARTEGRPDREEAAHQWIRALEPKLSTLTIDVPPGLVATQGLEVKRDGVIVGRAAWWTAMPVDPGSHVIEVTAPGKRAWTGIVVVRGGADRQRVTVPALEGEPAGVAPGDPAVLRADTALATGSQRPWSWQKRTALIAAVAATASLGAGTYFGLEAIRKNDDSQAGCIMDACDPAAKSLRLEARRAGTLSTVSFVAGGALAAAAVLLYLRADPPAAKSASDGPDVRAALSFGERAFGVSLQGSF